jgi:DNA adenine methylase
MRTVIPYYGGKARMAKRFVELMPKHKFYAEPYSGSAAVLLAKPKADREVINDLDVRLVKFWRVLRDRHQELAYSLFMTPYSEEEVRLSYEVSDDPLEDARRYFLSCTQTYNGGGTKASSWSLSLSEGGWAPESFHRSVARIYEVADRMRTVGVSNRDALTIIQHFDRRGAVIYCDPPYVISSRSGGDAYKHEQDDSHHKELAEALNNSQATILVSGYHSPLYDSLFDGWEVFEFDASKTSANTTKKKKPKAVEVIWRKMAHGIEGPIPQ